MVSAQFNLTFSCLNQFNHVECWQNSNTPLRLFPAVLCLEPAGVLWVPALISRKQILVEQTNINHLIWLLSFRRYSPKLQIIKPTLQVDNNKRITDR